jgi:hypothetical protein
MANFQNVGADVGAALDQPLLGRETGVAHKQHAEIAIAEHDYD